MTTTFRHYTNQMRFTEDFHKVFDFLVRINNEKVITPNFLWGRRIAISQGFRPTQKKECTAQIDIVPNLSYRLPDGCTISSLADDYDMRKLQRAIWRGFNHPGEPPDTEQDLLEQKISGSGPHRNETLNMKVTAPNGDYASYCGMWYLPGTSYALIEPVCTDPTYRMLGLGKAAVLEAVKRCGRLGAKVAYVGSPQQFYYNIGFYPTSTETWWELTKVNSNGGSNP